MKTHDDLIKELELKIDEKILELGNKPTPKYLTNLNVTFMGNNFNLNVLNTQGLLELYASIHSVIEASKTLDISYSDIYNNVLADIRSKLELARYNTKAKELNEMKSKLNNLLSEQAKKSKELDSLSEIISKL